MTIISSRAPATGSPRSPHPAGTTARAGRGRVPAHYDGSRSPARMPLPALGADDLSSEALVPTPKPDDGALDRELSVHQLVTSHLALADSVASRYVGRGIEREDLVQVARLALVKSAHRFRPEMGTSFAAFARVTIAGEVKRAFRDIGWMVRPPRELQELQARLRGIESDVEQNGGRHAGDEELAQAMGVCLEKVRAARQAAAGYRGVSLDTPGVESASRPAAVFRDMWNERDAFEALEERHWLDQALAQLTERQRRVLWLRYSGLQTQSEIAQQIGVSQMQVSRILAATLTRLRTLLESSA
jgi:RNA polymerase sigma-B factor